MYNRLVDHLLKNNLFDDQQHGFRKGKSVTTALVDFTETIIESVEKGNKVVGIFMDLTKAFDSISHKILLNKLKNIGLPNLQLKWFESYLLNRKQYVEITSIKDNQVLNHNSNIMEIKHGVPQGSILGPLLFLCYVQGMPSIINNTNDTQSNLILYADDSNLISTSKTYQGLEVSCREQIKNIKSYFKRNCLFLNTDKTNKMFFSTAQNKEKPTIRITINNSEINTVNVTTFLGIEIDNNLSWDDHVQKVTSKISTGLYILYRMSFLCNFDTLKSIYYDAHIHSHSSYGLAIYGGTT